MSALSDAAQTLRRHGLSRGLASLLAPALVGPSDGVPVDTGFSNGTTVTLTPEEYFNSVDGALDGTYNTNLPTDAAAYLVTIDVMAKETTDSYYYFLKPDATVEWWDNYWNGDGSMGDPQVMNPLKKGAPGEGLVVRDFVTLILPGGAWVFATGHDNAFGSSSKILAWPLT